LENVEANAVIGLDLNDRRGSHRVKPARETPMTP
jgi:hypothetical protein